MAAREQHEGRAQELRVREQVTSVMPRSPSIAAMFHNLAFRAPTDTLGRVVQPALVHRSMICGA